MTRVFPGRMTPGLRPAPAPCLRRPRATLAEALRVLRFIRPFAAPRLPDDVLACFDSRQRQIRPIPQLPPRPYPPLVVPFQRTSPRGEVRRARRR